MVSIRVNSAAKVTYINRYANYNLVVFDTSKRSLYNQIKTPLVSDHAFPLTGFVCSCYIWWQRWDNVNCQTGVALPM